MVLCGLAKAIARHLLTELNIIIFHDGLFNTSYCHYNQYEKLENNYKSSFWKSQHFFKKSERTYMLGIPPFLFVFVRFSMTPPPPLLVLFEWPLRQIQEVSIYDSWEIIAAKIFFTIGSISVKESGHVELLGKAVDV